MGSGKAVVRAADGTTRTYSLPVSLPTQAGFRFGVTVGANEARWLAAHPSGGSPASLQFAYNLVHPALGRPFGSHVKFFGDQGIDDADGMWHAWPEVSPNPLLTDEVWNPGRRDAWMTRLTAPAVYCWRQEFMDKVGPGKSTSFADYNTQLAQIRAQIDAHPNGHLVTLQLIGNEAIERTQPAGSPFWANIVVPPRCRIGCDTYVTQAQHLDPVKAFAGSVAWYRARKLDTPGVGLAISESGISRTNFTPAQRVKALGDFAAYLKTVDPSYWFTYWATDNSNKDPAKDWSVDKPGDASVAAKLASLIS